MACRRQRVDARRSGAITGQPNNAMQLTKRDGGWSARIRARESFKPRLAADRRVRRLWKRVWDVDSKDRAIRAVDVIVDNRR